MPEKKLFEKINKAIEFQTLERELTKDEGELENGLRETHEDILTEDSCFFFKRIDKQLEGLDIYDPDYQRIIHNMTNGNEPGF